MIRFEDGTRVAAAGGSNGPAEESARGTILLAGHGPTADGLARALEDQDEDVVIGADFATALSEAARLEPDTVLVGTDEAAGDGLRFIFDVLRAAPGAVVIALTDAVDVLETDLALAAGAHDVLAPPHSASAILFRRRVIRRTVHNRSRAPSRGELRTRVSLGHLVVDLASRQVLDGAEPLTLSGREFELLVRLMEARGEVVTRERLLYDIWGEEQGSEAVLDATVHRLRRRLEEKLPDDEVVATVRGVGYRVEAPGPALSGAS